MSKDQSERRLAAIMFTDVVGYTALMAESEEQGLRVRERHRELVRPLVERYGGESVEARGDESLSVFPSTLDAVRCALEIQDRLADDPELKLHIGIHTGDIIVRDGEVSGDGVNIASRICSLSEGSGLYISGEVYRSIRNQPDIDVIPLGGRVLKNVGQPVTVFAIGRPGAVSVKRQAAGTRTRWWSAAAVLGLAAVAALAWWGWGLLSTGASIRSIAVLPLENLSADPEDEYFADGMTEALISDLARIGSLRVISRTSILRYKGTHKSIPEIGRELDVDALVEGTALREGDRVRITAQLIDARRDAHLWAESYERDFAGSLALQGEVARAIVSEIALQLTPGERAQLARDRQVDATAYEAFLKGRYFWNRRTSEGFERAIEEFERAIEADPRYAPAYVGLADTYALLGVYSLAPHEAGSQAKAAALKALELDPDLAEAHARLGGIRLMYEWDWEGARREYERALELSPNNANAHRLYSIYLASVGRGEAALRATERARELDPLSPILTAALGGAYVDAGRIDEGIQQLREALRITPDFLPALRFLAVAYSRLGRQDEAAAELQRVVELSNRPKEILLAAEVYADMGRKDESVRLLEEVLQRARQDYVDPGRVAPVYAALDDRDKAFEWLERAYRERSTRLYSLNITPSAWDSIRSDPRFQDLMRRVGVPGGHDQ